MKSSVGTSKQFAEYIHTLAIPKLLHGDERCHWIPWYQSQRVLKNIALKLKAIGVLVPFR
jgi:hypothetical protein